MNKLRNCGQSKEVETKEKYKSEFSEFVNWAVDLSRKKVMGRHEKSEAPGAKWRGERTQHQNTEGKGEGEQSEKHQ